MAKAHAVIRDSARAVYVSRVATDSATKCAKTLADKLAVIVDNHDRSFERVVSSVPDPGRAGDEAVVPGVDEDWTDFVVLLTSDYAAANRGGAGQPAGEFAQVLAVLEAAGDPTAKTLWMAVIEDLPWRNVKIADRVLGRVDICHLLTNGQRLRRTPGAPPPTPQELKKVEIISTTPKTALDVQVGAVVDQLIDHPRDDCPACLAVRARAGAPPPPAAP